MKSRAATLLLVALAGPAAAQSNIPESAYRRDQVPVLQPERDPNAPPPYDAAAFRAAYAKAQRPTMVVLWNREFSDMLQQSNATRLVVDRAAVGVVNREIAGSPGYVASQTAGGVMSNTTITHQEGRTVQAQRAAPRENIDLQMRSTFMQTVSGAGVRLVDRNVVMRTSAAAQREKDKDDKLDTQLIEVAALAKYATLLMEVLNTRDPASPTGWSTFVSIKRLDNGLLVMEGYFNGRPADGAARPTPRFEPDPRGGFREAAPALSDTGKLVAEQMLARLGEALAQ